MKPPKGGRKSAKGTSKLRDCSDNSNSNQSKRSNSKNCSKIRDKKDDEERENALEIDSDEYFDSDVDEGDLNRSGNVPFDWYENEDHIGYTIDGEKLLREFDSSDVRKLTFESQDPDAWRTIADPRNNRLIKLTDEDLRIIQRIRKGMYPSDGYDQEKLRVEFDNKDSIHPVSYNPPPKSSFLPSKWEAMRIAKLVKLIKSGKIRPRVDKEDEDTVEDIWGDAVYSVDPKTARRGIKHDIKPPKIALPTHSESYNPPEEYLLDEEEKKEWLSTAPEDRKVDYMPQKYDCLRKVGVYEDLIVERFRRCLQLYLCPRAVKLMMNVDPESLFPKLPNLDDLRPFPTNPSVDYRLSGSASRIAVDFTGRWLACATGDGNISVCDVLCGRIFNSFGNFSPVYDLLWHPNLPILVVAYGSRLSFIAVELENQKRFATKDDQEIKRACKKVNVDESPYEKAVRLLGSTNEQNGWNNLEHESLIGLTVDHKDDISKVAMHASGNYVVVTCPKSKESLNQCVLHCLPKKASMKVGNKMSNNAIRAAIFHPTEPQLVVAFTREIRFYGLKVTTTKDSTKLEYNGKKLGGIELTVDMHINRQSSFLLAAAEGGNVSLFDLELGSFPYKKFSFESEEIVAVEFHQHLPLALIASSKGVVHCVHISPPKDSLCDPLIIPLKEIKTDGKLLDATWHSSEPWLFTTTPDGALMWA